MLSRRPPTLASHINKPIWTRSSVAKRTLSRLQNREQKSNIDWAQFIHASPFLLAILFFSFFYTNNENAAKMKNRFRRKRGMTATHRRAINSYTMRRNGRCKTCMANRFNFRVNRFALDLNSCSEECCLKRHMVTESQKTRFEKTDRKAGFVYSWCKNQF